MLQMQTYVSGGSGDNKLHIIWAFHDLWIRCHAADANLCQWRLVR